MDKTYFMKIVENLEKINETQSENIKKAASLMADAIEQDRLINVYGGGGHTTLCMGEMFFRAGGLANINPIMENGLTVLPDAEAAAATPANHSAIFSFSLFPLSVLRIV